MVQTRGGGCGGHVFGLSKTWLPFSAVSVRYWMKLCLSAPPSTDHGSWDLCQDCGRYERVERKATRSHVG